LSISPQGVGMEGYLAICFDLFAKPYFKELN